MPAAKRGPALKEMPWWCILPCIIYTVGHPSCLFDFKVLQDALLSVPFFPGY
jgi:hypothetical protein